MGSREKMIAKHSQFEGNVSREIRELIKRGETSSEGITQIVSEEHSVQCLPNAKKSCVGLRIFKQVSFSALNPELQIKLCASN